ncbi:MAG: DUF2279 domain-containing protein [Sphingobium sp.]
MAAASLFLTAPAHADDMADIALPDIALPDMDGFSLPPAVVSPAVANENRRGEFHGLNEGASFHAPAATEPPCMTANCAGPAPFAPAFAPLPSLPDFAHGPGLPPGAAGPPDDRPLPDTPSPGARLSFGKQVSAVKWEMAGVLAYYTAINGSKLFEDPQWPHFHKEGWFGKSTNNLGVDKLAHSYSTYIVSELLYARLKRKTGDAPGIAFTAAALASATMLYTEIWDSIEPTSGWSWEDVTFNTLGAGFSVLRNSVPGLDEKLDFRLMIVPHSGIISTEGKRHFEQQRYFFALKLSGFEGINRGPLRFLELHAGYYAKDFEARDRKAGIEPKRRLFVGVGINLRELFFKNSRSRVGRAAGEVLDYVQPPYTAVHHHITN